MAKSKSKQPKPETLLLEPGNNGLSRLETIEESVLPSESTKLTPVGSVDTKNVKIIVNKRNGHPPPPPPKPNKPTNGSLPRSQPMMSSSAGNLSNGSGAVLNQTSNNGQNRDYQRLTRVSIPPRPINRLARNRSRGMNSDSYKVIAFICGLFACILLIMGLASSEWLVSSGYRQGLFVYCVTNTTNGSAPKVPFVPDHEQGTDRTSIGCHRIDLNVQAYTLVAAAFVVVSLLVNVFSTLLTVLGLRCRDPNHKYKYYRIAVYVMAVALVSILVSLVVYPVCFAQIMPQSDRVYWEFGWAYGVGWGASIFLFGGIILLLCDKESEEIYYKERTIVQYADTNNKT